MKLARRHPWIVLGALAALLAGAAVLRLMLGVDFDPGRGGFVLTMSRPNGDFFAALAHDFAGDWLATRPDTILDIRLTRVIVAILAGAALSTSGVALQNLLRNPLAEPFILGLSAGAAVGFIGQRMIEDAVNRPLGHGYIGAIIGAMVIITLVYLGGRKRAVVDPLGMLLVGVILSTLCNAALMVCWSLAPQGDMIDLARWTMGSLKEAVGSTPMIVTTGLIIAGAAVLWVRHSTMDVALLSDGEAMSLGVNLTAHRTMLFLVGGALAAAAVVLAGPLAFVGLVCPHVARLLFGQAHRTLVPAAVLLGATLVVTADIGVTLIQFTQTRRLPIGVFTAILGGPIFLSLLRGQMGRGQE